MCVIPGYLELFSTALLAAPPQQPQGVHQKGGLLDRIKHHGGEPSTDSGIGLFCIWLHAEREDLLTHVS